MALEKTTVTVFGLEAINAYHRAKNLLLVGKDKIQFHVRSYAEKDKPFFGEEVIVCSYDLDGQNPLKQAYEHLKNTDAFKDAKAG
jgi:hypothetical protein